MGREKHPFSPYKAAAKAEAKNAHYRLLMRDIDIAIRYLELRRALPSMRKQDVLNKIADEFNVCAMTVHNKVSFWVNERRPLEWRKQIGLS